LKAKTAARRCFVVLCLTAAAACFAENTYSLDPAKELVIGSLSLGLAVSSLFVSRSASSASSEGFPLAKDGVNAFDRAAMYEYSGPLDTASDIILYGLAALPAVSLAVNPADKGVWAAFGVMYAESALLVFGTCELLKNTLLRYRPYCYSGGVPPGKAADYYKSFPSRHTAFAFMSAGFLASTMFTAWPDSPWKLPLSIAGYLLAAGTGTARVLSGSHFMSDVLAGAAIGSLYGYLIPRLHLSRRPETVTPVPLHNGFMFALRF